MKAIAVRNGKGSADDLYITDIPMPELKDGDVLVRVYAFGLNRMDLIQREGHYPLPPQAPVTLGVEFSGYIEKVSPGVNDFHIKQKVFGLAYGGAYAEYIAVSHKMISDLPDKMSMEEAAGMCEVWFTAIQALYTIGNLQKGQNVLFHAGASGVGNAAIQLVKNQGGTVYTTAGSDEKCRFCESLGAKKAVNYKKEDFAEVIAKDVGENSIDLIVDVIGAPYLAKNITLAARDGKIVQLAFMGGANIENLNLGPILFKRLQFVGSTLRSRDASYQGLLRDKFNEIALPKLADGTFKVVIDTVDSWKNITKMHKRMESNATTGKLICIVD